MELLTICDDDIFHKKWEKKIPTTFACSVMSQLLVCTTSIQFVFFLNFPAFLVHMFLVFFKLTNVWRDLLKKKE